MRHTKIACVCDDQSPSIIWTPRSTLFGISSVRGGSISLTVMSGHRLFSQASLLRFCLQASSFVMCASASVCVSNIFIYFQVWIRREWPAVRTSLLRCSNSDLFRKLARDEESCVVGWVFVRYRSCNEESCRSSRSKLMESLFLSSALLVCFIIIIFFCGCCGKGDMGGLSISLNFLCTSIQSIEDEFDLFVWLEMRESLWSACSRLAEIRNIICYLLFPCSFCFPFLLLRSICFCFYLLFPWVDGNNCNHLDVRVRHLTWHLIFILFSFDFGLDFCWL